MALGRPLALNERSWTASDRVRYALVIAICLRFQPLGGLLLQKLPEVADELHPLELFLRKLDVVLVLDGGDELDQVEGVGGEVALKALVHLHLVRLDAENLGGELLKFLEVELAGHSPLLIGLWGLDYEARVVAAETERVRQRHLDVGFARLVGHIVEVALRVGVVEVDRGRHQTAVEGQDAFSGSSLRSLVALIWQNAPIVSGVMVASEPPASMATASPRLMISAASPMPWEPDAHALTMA